MMERWRGCSVEFESSVGASGLKPRVAAASSIPTSRVGRSSRASVSSQRSTVDRREDGRGARKLTGLQCRALESSVGALSVEQSNVERGAVQRRAWSIEVRASNIGHRPSTVPTSSIDYRSSIECWGVALSSVEHWRFNGESFSTERS
jgi:hypothetical protein